MTTIPGCLFLLKSRYIRGAIPFKAIHDFENLKKSTRITFCTYRRYITLFTERLILQNHFS